MRYQILKLTKSTSTKAERRFMELCKQLHIPFKAKVKISGREIDFLIGQYAIEIDGHAQSVEKNNLIHRAGYIPIHIDNKEVGSQLKQWLKNLC